MGVRTELLVEYHNSRGHQGRDTTCEASARDWWWPRTYSDIKYALTGCTVCAGQHAVNRVIVWARTTLYAHPFMALQFDFRKCPEVNGYADIRLVTCLFSRWVWLIVTMDRLAETVAERLLCKVFWPWNVWPGVLRSDNAYEFIGEVIRYVNAKLEIRHITGAAYRPQNQGLA